MTKPRLRLALLLLGASLATACTTLTDLKTTVSESMFGRELVNPPGELPEISPKLQTRVVWSANLGEAGDYDFSPAMADGMVYAASAAGKIVKIDAITGKEVWRIDAGERLSGGVGLGPNLLLAGSAKGYVLAFDQAGKALWRAKVSSEVLSAPQAAGDMVVVRAGDSRIFGLNAADGSRKWVHERATPALSLRSSAGVTIADDTVYAGFAGGKLIALRAADGGLLWETAVAQPKGTTEIERIADITSLPVVDGSQVYAAAYQGKIAAVDRASGRILWSRDISSYTGIGFEGARIYLSHATDSVYALDYSNGRTFWRQGDLINRRVSAPLPLGDRLAVGDVEGYIHVLDKDDGALIGRLRLEESPVMPQLAELGSDGLLAQTRSGKLYAVSLK